MCGFTGTRIPLNPLGEWCGNFHLPFLSLKGCSALYYQEVHQEPIPQLLHE